VEVFTPTTDAEGEIVVLHGFDENKDMDSLIQTGSLKFDNFFKRVSNYK
jgi:hypothetical protein